MQVLFSYDPEDVERFEQRLKQAEERAEFFEKAWLIDHEENLKLKQELQSR